MFLYEIYEDLDLERRELECRSRLDREDFVVWLKSIAGFANAHGGDFYLGVEDQTHRLIGFDRGDADNERNYFNDMADEHLTPRPPMEISFLLQGYLPADLPADMKDMKLRTAAEPAAARLKRRSGSPRGSGCRLSRTTDRS